MGKYVQRWPEELQELCISSGTEIRRGVIGGFGFHLGSALAFYSVFSLVLFPFLLLLYRYREWGILGSYAAKQMRGCTKWLMYLLLLLLHVWLIFRVEKYMADAAIENGGGEWSFGQCLAVMMLLGLIFDFIGVYNDIQGNLKTLDRALSPILDLSMFLFVAFVSIITWIWTFLTWVMFVLWWLRYVLAVLPILIAFIFAFWISVLFLELFVSFVLHVFGELLGILLSMILAAPLWLWLYITLLSFIISAFHAVGLLDDQPCNSQSSHRKISHAPS